jgi:hypothetical protein
LAVIKETEQLGYKFIEIDIDDHPNITITAHGMPIVLIRDNGEKVAVNVLDMLNPLTDGKWISLSRNNASMDGLVYGA